MTDQLGIRAREVGWGWGVAGPQYVSLCYYSLRVGWRHEKQGKEEVEEEEGGLQQTGRGLAV